MPLLTGVSLVVHGRTFNQPSEFCVLYEGSDKYFDDKEGGGPPGAEGEMYPYVSFSISIDS